MITNLLLLLLPLAALSGWFLGRKKQPNKMKPSAGTFSLPQDYFVGLSYLINEQADKAVDIFIKLLEVNSDTFETHLTLGSLFRRRGEVDRAIRLHQNLIARPQLNKTQRTQALAALAEDYLRAGVLDRAERLLIELSEITENNPQLVNSLQHLLHLYEQQKDWEQAIIIAKKIAQLTGEIQHIAIAHFYCEIAEVAVNKKQLEKARKHLQMALKADPHCARANLLLGTLEMMTAQFKSAITAFQQIMQQDADYISEIIKPMAECYMQLNQEKQLIADLMTYVKTYPRITLVLVLSEHLRKFQGNKTAIEFIASQIRLHPSLRGVAHLVELYLESSQGDARDKLSILQHFINALLADKPIYRCGQCGFSAKILYWQCPQCRHWNSVKPIHGLEGD